MTINDDGAADEAAETVLATAGGPVCLTGQPDTAGAGRQVS